MYGQQEQSADDWEELLLLEIEWLQKQGRQVVFRADAAFAKPETDEALEARGSRNKRNFHTAMYFHCGGLDMAPSCH